MPATPEDVGNRALQHLGAERLTTLQDDSKNAAAVEFCYAKLRKAELRRNVWRFAVREVALRPVDTDTLFFTSEEWDEDADYLAGSIVKINGRLWQTPLDSTGENPNLTLSPWDLYCGPLTVVPHDTATSYYSGELVSSGLSVYCSLLNNNDTTPPSSSWLDVGLIADVTEPLNILYPIGAGPASQSGTLNLYRLPSFYMRKAPLGGDQYPSWRLEGEYILDHGSSGGVIIFRFVTDMTKVDRFDTMFIEGLAARIAFEICEEVTQSTDKQRACGAAYKTFMGEARTVNSIETGPDEPPEDDYIKCRS